MRDEKLGLVDGQSQSLDRTKQTVVSNVTATLMGVSERQVQQEPFSPALEHGQAALARIAGCHSCLAETVFHLAAHKLGENLHPAELGTWASAAPCLVSSRDPQ